MIPRHDPDLNDDEIRPVDPTANVIALSKAATQRQDDLRNANDRRMDEAITNVKFLQGLRADHAKEIRDLESRRLDAIRQVDVTAVKTEADRALAAIQTLAATTATNAENLRNALTSTAATIAKQTSDTVAQITERIAALEKSSYEGKGRSGVSDPMFAELLVEMKHMREASARGAGQVRGISGSWATLLGVVTLIAALFGMSNLILNRIDRTAPPPVAVPK